MRGSQGILKFKASPAGSLEEFPFFHNADMLIFPLIAKLNQQKDVEIANFHHDEPTGTLDIKTDAKAMK